jgi:adenylylsulfate kinase-like enzyme
LRANDCTKPSEEGCKIFQHFGVVVITALISPYREGRNYARQLIGDFVEVYVQCPLQVLIERDVKGLYAKALKGEIPNFTGISDPYEPPENPEVIVETDKETVDESVEKKFGKRFWRWVTCLKRCSANLCWRKGVESASANGWG